MVRFLPVVIRQQQKHLQVRIILAEQNIFMPEQADPDL